MIIINVIYTDGSCKTRGKKRCAGIGFVILDENENDIIIEKSKYIGNEPSYVAEWAAVIDALKTSYELGLLNIIIKTDSQFVVKQIKGEYRVKSKELKPYYNKAWKLIPKFDSVKFVWINRGRNKMADKLAQEASETGFK